MHRGTARALQLWRFGCDWALFNDKTPLFLTKAAVGLLNAGTPSDVDDEGWAVFDISAAKGCADIGQWQRQWWQRQVICSSIADLFTINQLQITALSSALVLLHADTHRRVL